MKKIVLGIFCLLLLVLFVGSFVTGPVAHSAIEQQIAKINRMPGYQAELVEYSENWRTAQGKVRVGFDWGLYANMSADDPQLQKKIQQMPSSLLLDVQVNHGPVLPQDGFGIGVAYIEMRPDVSNYPQLQAFQQKVDIDALFTYQATVGLLGRSPFAFTSPAFDWINEENGGTLSYGGARFSGSYDARSHNLIMNGALAPLSFAGEKGAVQVSAIELSGDLELVNDMVSLGEMTMTLANITVNERQSVGNDSLASVNDLVVRYSGSRDGDNTVKMAVQYGIGELLAGDEQLADMNVQIVFERLGVDALQKYYDQLIGLYQNAEGVSDLQQRQLAMMSELGLEFLKYSPAMHIPDISFTMNDGRFSANARVDFDGQGAEIVAADLANPLMLMARLKIVAALSFDQQLLETLGVKILADQISAQLVSQNQQMSEDEVNELAKSQLQMALTQQVDQGIIVSTSEGYRAAFSLEKGAMQLNGKPFSPF